MDTTDDSVPEDPHDEARSGRGGAGRRRLDRALELCREVLARTRVIRARCSWRRTPSGASAISSAPRPATGRSPELATDHSPAWSGLSSVLFDQLRFGDARVAALRALRADTHEPRGRPRPRPAARAPRRSPRGRARLPAGRPARSRGIPAAGAPDRRDDHRGDRGGEARPAPDRPRVPRSGRVRGGRGPERGAVPRVRSAGPPGRAPRVLQRRRALGPGSATTRGPRSRPPSCCSGGTSSGSPGIGST